MSVRIMASVLDYFPVGGTRKLALLCLADHANDSGSNCYPSIRHIARRLCCSDAQARRHVHALIEDGFVSVEPGTENGGGRSRHYRINLDCLTPRTNARGSTDATPPLASSAHDPSHGCKPNRKETSMKREREPTHPAVPLSADFEPTEKNKEWARSNGLDDWEISATTEKFRAHYQSRNTRCVNWHAAWSKWVIGDLQAKHRNGAAHA